MFSLHPLSRLFAWLSLLATLFTNLPAFAQTTKQPLTSQTLSTAMPNPLPFGFETTTGQLANPTILNYAKQLGASFVRLNTVSWRSVQPTQDLPLAQWNWSALATFEQELQAAKTANLTPIVVVDDYPHWATLYNNACGALKTENFTDFATFMRELVTRYKQEPYNLVYWELGNEPDIDPQMVQVDNFFGCWGDIGDPYYGGKQYGEMLKVVTPAIKQADPQAKVMNGGFLLDRPDTTIIGRGKPEKFLEGILEAGAGESFDILAYHAYPWYSGRPVDGDLGDFRWTALGGATVGKARFLRALMAQYKIDKPLFLNETSLLGMTYTADFYEAQGDHVVRVLARGLAEGIQAFSWYTFNESGWAAAGLIDVNNVPRPAYFAYQQLIKQVAQAKEIPLATTDYGSEVEAYRFKVNDRLVDLLWSRDSSSKSISLSKAAFIGAYTRDGTAIKPLETDTRAVLDVDYIPIYIWRSPMSDGQAPQISAISPIESYNNQVSHLTITGTNFVAFSTVFLEGVFAQKSKSFALKNVVFRDTNHLEADLPAGLPSGTYDLIVSNPGGWIGTLPHAFTVLGFEPALEEIRPNVGQTDLPNEILIKGNNFAAGITVTLGTALLNVTRLSGTLLRAALPANVLASGAYSLTVTNPGGNYALLANAYTVFTANNAAEIDFTASPDEFWTNPISPRAKEATQIGIIVQRYGNSQLAQDVPVHFYLGDPANGGTFLGESVAHFKAADRAVATTGLSWTPELTGTYPLFAKIDPENTLKETLETNNTLSRNIDVLSLSLDRTAPQLDKFTINDGAANTTESTVKIAVNATDPSPGTSAASILFVEYEYSQGAKQWIAVQASRWMPFTTGQTYTWALIPTPGVKYLQSWVADKAGNVSAPKQAFINYLPSNDRLFKDQGRIYRYQLQKGDSFKVQTVPSNSIGGDLDLLAWVANSAKPLQSSMKSSGSDEVSFTASAANLYQIEVYAASTNFYAGVYNGDLAEYNLTFNLKQNANSNLAASTEKVVPTQPIVALESFPEQKYTLTSVPMLSNAVFYPLYLPFIQR